jgi:hypothetical protein
MIIILRCHIRGIVSTKVQDIIGNREKGLGDLGIGGF